MIRAISLFFILFSIVSSYQIRKIPSNSLRKFDLKSTVTNKLDGITITGSLQPIANNILVKVKEVPMSTAGGLFLPDNAKERPTEGTVIASGPGRVHPETAVQLDLAVTVGESVLYGKYDGTELKYNEADHQLIKDDDVLLRYSGEKATFDNVIPVKDQVLVKLPPKEEKNAAGIIISTPGSKEKRRDYGEVKKIGPGRQAGNGQYQTTQVKPGDFCRFREYAGTEVKLDGEDYLVVRAYDILAKW